MTDCLPTTTSWDFHRPKDPHNDVWVCAGTSLRCEQSLSIFLVCQQEGSSSLPHWPSLLTDQYTRVSQWNYHSLAQFFCASCFLTIVFNQAFRMPKSNKYVCYCRWVLRIDVIKAKLLLLLSRYATQLIYTEIVAVFYEERAILLGKQGRHEEALAIYVHVLCDNRMAEEYVCILFVL